MHSAACLMAIALLAAEPGELPPDPRAMHPVRLDRVHRVGDRFRIDATLESAEIESLTIEDLPPREKRVTRWTLHLVADGVNEAVDGRAQPRRVRYTIVSARFVEKDAESPFLPVGHIVVVHDLDDLPHLRDDEGDILAEAWHGPLSRVIGVNDPVVAGDAIFGSDEPRRVGDSWFADIEAVMDRTHCRGSVTAEATLIDADKSSVTVRQFTRCEQIPDVTVEQRSRTLYARTEETVREATFPLDPSLPVSQETITWTRRFTSVDERSVEDDGRKATVWQKFATRTTQTQTTVRILRTRL